MVKTGQLLSFIQIKVLSQQSDKFLSYIKLKRDTKAKLHSYMAFFKAKIDKQTEDPELHIKTIYYLWSPCRW